MCYKPERDFPTEKMKTGKNDHPGYSCERAQWALVTGVEPLNCLSGSQPAVAIIGYRGCYVNPVLQTHPALQPLALIL
jgi:hypothetical protein